MIVNGTAAGELITGSGGPDVLRGYAGDDTLLGLTGDDTLDGGLGNDTLDGGDGNNWAVYDLATAGGTYQGQPLTVDLTLAGAQDTGAAGIDTLINIRNLWTNIMSSMLRGDGNANVLTGPGTIYGGGGNDTIVNATESYGEAGNDTIQYNLEHAEVFGGDDDDLIYGYDQDRDPLLFSGGYGLYSYILDGGNGRDTIYGTPKADMIFGGNGDDVIWSAGFVYSKSVTSTGADYVDAGAGNDVIYAYLEGGVTLGGAGDDKINLIVTNRGILGATIDGGDGRDILTAAYLGPGTSFFDLDRPASNARSVVVTNVETLQTGAGDHVVLAGGSFNYVIQAGSGNDVISGGSGSDTITGGGGNDELFGGAGDDLIVGGSGVSVLQGEGGSDRLIGGTGGETLIGGDGDDILQPGGGVDTLVGGSGADRFVFTSLSDSQINGADRIWDFNHNEGDVIDLSQIDTLSYQAGDQSFTLTPEGRGLANGEAHLTYDASTDTTKFVGRGFTDFGSKDIVVYVNGNHIDPSDWIL